MPQLTQNRFRAEIKNEFNRTRLQIFNAENRTLFCSDCGDAEFTFIQTDYVVCVNCGKKQPFELEWTKNGVEAIQK